MSIHKHSTKPPQEVNINKAFLSKRTASKSGSFPEYADYLTIKDGTPSINHSTRYNGRTIRPVCIYPAE